MNKDTISISGARTHNLKNIDLVIPKNSLTVITGLSGSGKSSLAFDTLYAEGQRRYVESLSTYARQFLGQMDKPDVDAIEGLSPAIAIEQKSVSHNPRSTVGTITEIHDYLRLLYARIGKPHCPRCGELVLSASIDQMVDQVMGFEHSTKIMVLSPVVDGQKGSHEILLNRLKKEGFARVRVDGDTHLIDEISTLEKDETHTIDVVVDRLVIKPGVEKRLADSLELALQLSSGRASVLDVTQNRELSFSENAACLQCNIQLPEFTPASFSFNSPKGACPLCNGLGTTTRFDPDLIVPDPDCSLRQGAVVPWENKDSVPFMEFLDALVTHYGENIYIPFKQLSKKFQQVVLYGSKKEKIPFYVERAGKKIVYHKPFEGVIPKLRQRLDESGSRYEKDEIKRFMTFKPCSRCKGTRLNTDSLAVRIGQYNIHDISSLLIPQVVDCFGSLSFDGKDKVVGQGVINEIIARLDFLRDVGLEYLTLSRSAATLSGGESQRIRLATQLGSRLSGVLYVLDEPSIGLHQKDNAQLLKTLMNLRDLGNTVLVVEHDEDTIQSSDYVVDMGPGAGVSGGQVMFAGTPEELVTDGSSLTGQYLSGEMKIHLPEKRRGNSGRTLTIFNAHSNNLKHIDVAFPIGCFTCVTGVSGSGKSTLVLSTLYPILSNHLNFAKRTAGKYEKIEGVKYLDKVIHIDQSPIGKTPRSNPGTYTQVFNPIRQLFAQTKEAKTRGYKPGRFSFNVKGGRCEACQGDGILKIEMHFLPDVYVVCDVCKGKRYNRETLEIKYKDKNIADVLDMTILQCVDFFDNIWSIKAKLDTLVSVGLGYMKLGQSGTTLSGGESQRIKLARELSRKSTGSTIYILDEPTTGLHSDDINKLLYVINKLVDAGNTVIVIEHNLDVIKCADHVIDLGPEGGDNGGKIVAVGTPEEIAGTPHSYTGYYLKGKLS